MKIIYRYMYNNNNVNNNMLTGKYVERDSIKKLYI